MTVRRILIGVVLVTIVLAAALGIAAYRAVGTFAVAIPESLTGDEPGALVAVERTGKYPSFVVQYILNTVDLPDPIDVKYGMTLYRVQYRTTNYDGSVVVASGLVALPNRSELHSVVAYSPRYKRRTAYGSFPAGIGGRDAHCRGHGGHGAYSVGP